MQSGYRALSAISNWNVSTLWCPLSTKSPLKIEHLETQRDRYVDHGYSDTYLKQEFVATASERLDGAVTPAERNQQESFPATL